MTLPYTCVDLEHAVEIPSAGILSRTIYTDPTITVIMFGFDAGQELSEHTAARPALLQFLRGEAQLTLGGDPVAAHPGTLVHMPAGLAHSVRAVTPLVMQLILLTDSLVQEPAGPAPE